MSDLYVVSPSTKKYAWGQRTFVVKEKLSIDILYIENSESRVVAIGGGAVIDAAKIIAKDRLVCFPTTASGSSLSKHSVIWDGTVKKSHPSRKADLVEVNDDYCVGLSDEVKFNTRVDVWAHAIDTLYSKKATKESKKLSEHILERLSDKNMSVADLVHVGNKGGELIAMVPTTLLHGLSYPLTGLYDISHGYAMSMAIQGLCDALELDADKWFDHTTLAQRNINLCAKIPEDYSKSKLLTEMLKYDKIKDFKLGYKITGAVISQLFGM